MIRTLEKAELRTEPHIRRVFSRSGQGFDAALGFLVSVGVVNRSEGGLSLSTDLPDDAEKVCCVWLLSAILRVHNKYRTEIFRYLRKYRVDEGDLVYEAAVDCRSRESAVRNFLMELGIVELSDEGSRHRVSRDYISLYAQAVDAGRNLSPASFAESLVCKDALGLTAEKAVVSYERDRLGMGLADYVDHVSLRNAAAGYDIRSISLSNVREKIPRYIEVKAVSTESVSFYWTRNEIAVAKKLGDFYFLYLVPISATGAVDVSCIHIIPNPHKAVLQSKDEWITESDVIRCFTRGQHNAFGVKQHG
ncbi:MAG: DUF3883 domain-containing protein [Candidatus Hydrogenedentes bacterium]|nr:DUF3883 domain-containing protein [Candidatus Hydrogenedentota bacterium]